MTGSVLLCGEAHHMWQMGGGQHLRLTHITVFVCAVCESCREIPQARCGQWGAAACTHARPIILQSNPVRLCRLLPAVACC